MRARQLLIIMILLLWAMVILAPATSTMAQSPDLSPAKETMAIGKGDSKVYMKSDNNILFHTGGGHIEWQITGPVATEIRTIVDKNNDWTITEYEARTYISAIDSSLTIRHMNYHGAKLLSFSLLDKSITTDTSGLIGEVNITDSISINFIYDAAPSDRSAPMQLSDSTFVAVLFQVLGNDTTIYKYVGKSEIKHENTFVGFMRFVLPEKGVMGHYTHYQMPMAVYYEYEISFKGAYAAEEDWMEYQAPHPIQNTLTIFIILLVFWILSISIPKWIASSQNKKQVFGLRSGLGVMAVLDLLIWILAFKDLIVYGFAILIMVMAGAIGYYVYMRSKIAKDIDVEAKIKDDEDIDKKIKKAIKEKKLVSEDEPEEEKAIDDFDIEEAFYIYKDGRVVTHLSAGARDSVAEKDLVGSMLVAIQGFVGDSFRREGDLDGFDFGNNKIVVRTGNHGHLVSVLTGIEPPFLKDRMSEVIQRIEGKFAGIIEDWDGDHGSFKGINAMIAPIFDLKKGVKIRAKPQVVKVKSAIEFYEGFLRLKVGIINERKTSITDTVFRLQYDKRALRLNNIDPAYPMDGSAVEIGVVSPGEKKSIAYYLDPLTCQVTNIDGSATYRDYKGQFQTAMMKRRPAEIVCPIFFTPSTVNVAMLRRLKKDLPYKDSRVYEMPAGIDLKKVYFIAKEAVMAHNVREVKDFMEPRPFRGETWFYGKTAETNEEMIIKVTVNHETNTAQVWVASNNLATQAGLIAEVGHVMGKKMKEQMAVTQEILPSTNMMLKKRLEEEEVLLDKLDNISVEDII